METDVLFCLFWENMDTAVSIAITVTAAPLEFRHPPTTSVPLSSALLSVRSFLHGCQKKGAPVHLLLIYLGHACENRSMFHGSPRARIRERGCDCREIKPLKVMPCLIFTATNERSSPLSQTSSQAAIIPSRGSVHGRQKGGSITSPDLPTLYVCGGVVCVCVCAFIWLCESVRLYLSTLHVCVCLPALSYLFLFLIVSVGSLTEASSIQVQLVFKPQEGP